MPWQFRVVDGADQGRIYPLFDHATTPIGSSRKNAEIALNDIYVARIHAEVEVDGPRVVVSDHGSPAGTLVNGQKVRQQEVHHGDVVRMGNSHLRLEDVATAATEAPPEEDLPEYEVEVLTEDTAAGPPATSPAAATPIAFKTEGGARSEAEVAVKPSLANTRGSDSHSVAHTPAAPAKEPVTPDEKLAALVGHELAHFQIQEAIGKGHSGMVFQALDRKSGKLVALKVLAPDFPHTDAEMQHFVQVVKTVLPLRHAHLVPLYGVGKAGPFCWIAMERVECVSLPAIIDRISRVDKIDWHRPYRVAVQIGRALAYAHEYHVIHRNITARQVLWRADDKVAKLTDLGLPFALQGSNLRKVTMRERLQADLPYLSPEQTEPKGFVDGVCDIYSLGVVVYALLTGRYPFTAPAQADLVRKIRETPPTRPTKLQAGIPDRLERIVLKMLAKHQEDRYQKAEELLADLQVVGEEEDALV